MFTELIASFAPALTAAIVLVPTSVFITAMLFEGAGKERWGKIRRVTRKSIETQPLRLPVRRQHSNSSGGLGLRRALQA